jgi:aspartate/methionine/tyrosine aminotransferase
MAGPEKNLNLYVRGMRSSATVAINERSDALRTEGHDIIKFGLGQSPFPVPECVVQSLRDHAHEKDYLPVKGLRTLRDTVARFHEVRDGITGRSGDDVLVGPGSKELLFLLQLVFYGDLVIPAPAWVSYAPQARILGRQVRMVPTSRENGWRLSPEELERICLEDADRPRILILNYPSNPTGLTFDTAQLEALANVVRKYQMVVVSDEIYGEVHHEGGHVSMARYYPEGTIVSAGLSKWCGAGGWRIGTFFFPPQMRWLLDAMATAASETYTSVCAPIQHASVRAFEGGDEIEIYLEQSRRVLKAIGNWSSAKLRAVGAAVDDPQGAFYLFPEFENIRARLESRGVRTSEALCQLLLEDTGVAVLPGSDFGRPHEELSIRLAYVDFDGSAALANASGTLDEQWLRQNCPRIVDGIERMAAWLS